jgi:hypothetical protein
MEVSRESHNYLRLSRVPKKANAALYGRPSEDTWPVSELLALVAEVSEEPDGIQDQIGGVDAA